MTKWRRWFPVLLACAAFAWPGTAALATTSSSTLQAAPLPCGASTSGAPCRADPSQIQVDIPTGVQAVQVSWVPGVGRPSSAPAPDSQQVVLTVANGPSGPASCQGPAPAPSGTTAYCWNWPSSLEYTLDGTNWLLNGTYRVTACSATSSSTPCTYSSQYNSTLTEIAVAPAAPTQVSATQSNGGVNLDWKAGPEPDLVGYAVSRDNQPVYTCSTDGAGPGAGTPCANPPSFHDIPGTGTWSYTVSALRFGADASASHVVASTPAASSVYVPAPAASAGGGGTAYTGGSPGHAVVPPLPPLGTMRPAQLNSASGVAATAVPSLADAEDSGGAATGTPGALPYNDKPTLNGALASGTLAVQQKTKGSIDAAAELALGVLALALAVHIWYVRGELRVASIRVAARRAAGEAPG
ncbi:MAG TPA: hypothetical protein VNF71_04440 [Acidimicrobiales bacterium]|nr:hypothetical protein [Acidimicrobiales bacterium]